MKGTAALAFRNLGRNKRRTVSTLLSIVFSIVALSFLSGYLRYSMWGLKETTIRSGTGHLQISTSLRYFDEGESDPFPYLLSDTKSLVRKIASLPEVKDVVESVTFTALLQVDGRMQSVTVKAIPFESAQEHLSFLTLDEGALFQESGDSNVVVGSLLAKRMHLELGSELSLFAVGQKGGVDHRTYRVGGVASTNVTQLDSRSIYMDLDAAKRWLSTDQVPVLTVYLERTQDTDSVKARIENWGAVKTWEELSGFYRQASASYAMIQSVAQTIVWIVTLFSISGALWMGVWERTREIGTLRAFGTKRYQILTMFLWEGLFIGFAGAVLGSLAGAAATFAVNSWGGITVAPQPGMSEAMVVYFRLEWESSVVDAAFVVVASVVGAVLPGGFAGTRNAASLLRSP